MCRFTLESNLVIGDGMQMAKRFAVIRIKCVDIFREENRLSVYALAVTVNAFSTVPNVPKGLRPVSKLK